MKKLLLYPLVLLLSLAVVSSARPEEIVVDPMVAAGQWTTTGQRVCYSLGKTAVGAASDPARPGTPGSVRFTYDLDRRSWVGLQWQGGPLPGHVQALSFWLHGDGSKHRLAARFEDARGRGFEAALGVMDWEGWRQVAVPMEETKWRAVLRHGETALPVRPPVALREIRILKGAPEPLVGAVALADLRAVTEVTPADRVQVAVTSDAPANTFYVPEPTVLHARFTNAGQRAIEGRFEAVAEDWLGREQRFPGEPLALAPGATVERRVKLPISRLGSYTGWVRFVTSDGVCEGSRRFAVSRRSTGPARTDPESPFGMGCYLQRFGSDAERRQAILLAREAGVKWTRDTLSVAVMRPSPDRWAWEGPRWVPGSVELGESRGLTVPGSPSLNRPCETGELTLALRLKLRRLDYTQRWCMLLQKGEEPGRRQHSLYLTVPTRQLAVSFGDGKGGWTDVPCTKSDWEVGRWYEVVLAHRRADRSVRWYVDGAPAGSGETRFTGTLVANDMPLEIGRGLDCTLDDLAIYDRALAPEEMAGAKPVARWMFDEGKGPRAADASGNGNDAREMPLRQDRILDEAAAAGISTYAILSGTAAWMAGRPTEGLPRPWTVMPRTEEWSQAVEGIVRRYREKGVRVWEIWNEPNIEPFWAPQPDAGEYYQVLAASYHAIKKADPRATVLGCSLAGPHGQAHRPPWEFVEEVLKRGGGKVMDGISIHPYRQPSTPEDSDYRGDLKAISDLTAKYGRRLPIWITEVGWPNDTGGSGEAWATKMLPRAYLLALASGVRNVAWYDYHDDGQDPSYLEHHCGLLLYDLTPKPLYFAYRTIATELAGMRFEREVDAGTGATVLLFAGKGKRAAVAWSHHGETPIALRMAGTARATTLDLMGNPRERKVPDGALVLGLTEDAILLRDAPASLSAVRPVECRPAVLKLPKGEAGRLQVTLCNPFTKPLSLAASGQQVTLPPGGERVVEIPVSAEQARTWAAPVWRSADGRAAWKTPARVVALSGQREPIFQWRGETSEPITVPHTPALDATDEVTLLCRLRSEGPNGTWQNPVCKFAESVHRNYGLYLGREKGEPCFTASFERGTYQHNDFGAGGMSLFDGKWHTVAATYSRHDAEVCLYVDGALIRRASFDGGNLKPNTATLVIARDLLADQEGKRVPRGAVREVRVWNRALSAEEVARW